MNQTSQQQQSLNADLQLQEQNISDEEKVSPGQSVAQSSFEVTTQRPMKPIRFPATKSSQDESDNISNLINASQFDAPKRSDVTVSKTTVPAIDLANSQLISSIALNDLNLVKEVNDGTSSPPAVAISSRIVLSKAISRPTEKEEKDNVDEMAKQTKLEFEKYSPKRRGDRQHKVLVPTATEQYAISSLIEKPQGLTKNDSGNASQQFLMNGQYHASGQSETKSYAKTSQALEHDTFEVTMKRDEKDVNYLLNKDLSIIHSRAAKAVGTSTSGGPSFASRHESQITIINQQAEMIKQYERMLGNIDALHQPGWADNIIEEQPPYQEESRQQKRRQSQQGIMRGNALTAAMAPRRSERGSRDLDLLVQSKHVQGVYQDSVPVRQPSSQKRNSGRQIDQNKKIARGNVLVPNHYQPIVTNDAIQTIQLKGVAFDHPPMKIQKVPRLSRFHIVDQSVTGRNSTETAQVEDPLTIEQTVEDGNHEIVISQQNTDRGLRGLSSEQTLALRKSNQLTSKESDKELKEKEEILTQELENHVKSHRQMKKLAEQSSRLKLNDIAEEVLKQQIAEQRKSGELNIVASDSHEIALILPEFQAQGVARVQTHKLLPNAEEVRDGNPVPPGSQAIIHIQMKENERTRQSPIKHTMGKNLNSIGGTSAVKEASYSLIQNESLTFLPRIDSVNKQPDTLQSHPVHNMSQIMIKQSSLPNAQDSSESLPKIVKHAYDTSLLSSVATPESTFILQQYTPVDSPKMDLKQIDGMQKPKERHSIVHNLRDAKARYQPQRVNQADLNDLVLDSRRSSQQEVKLPILIQDENFEDFGGYQSLKSLAPIETELLHHSADHFQVNDSNQLKKMRKKISQQKRNSVVVFNKDQETLRSPSKRGRPNDKVPIEPDGHRFLSKTGYVPKEDRLEPTSTTYQKNPADFLHDSHAQSILDSLIESGGDKQKQVIKHVEEDEVVTPSHGLTMSDNIRPMKVQLASGPSSLPDPGQDYFDVPHQTGSREDLEPTKEVDLIGAEDTESLTKRQNSIAERSFQVVNMKSQLAKSSEGSRVKPPEPMPHISRQTSKDIIMAAQFTSHYGSGIMVHQLSNNELAQSKTGQEASELSIEMATHGLGFSTDKLKSKIRLRPREQLKPKFSSEVSHSQNFDRERMNSLQDANNVILSLSPEANSKTVSGAISKAKSTVRSSIAEVKMKSLIRNVQMNPLEDYQNGSVKTSKKNSVRNSTIQSAVSKKEKKDQGTSAKQDTNYATLDTLRKLHQNTRTGAEQLPNMMTQALKTDSYSLIPKQVASEVPTPLPAHILTRDNSLLGQYHPQLYHSLQSSDSNDNLLGLAVANSQNVMKFKSKIASKLIEKRVMFATSVLEKAPLAQQIVLKGLKQDQTSKRYISLVVPKNIASAKEFVLNDRDQTEKISNTSPTLFDERTLLMPSKRVLQEDPSMSLKHLSSFKSQSRYRQVQSSLNINKMSMSNLEKSSSKNQENVLKTARDSIHSDHKPVAYSDYFGYVGESKILTRKPTSGIKNEDSASKLKQNSIFSSKISEQKSQKDMLKLKETRSNHKLSNSVNPSPFFERSHMKATSKQLSSISKLDEIKRRSQMTSIDSTLTEQKTDEKWTRFDDLGKYHGLMRIYENYLRDGDKHLSDQIARSHNLIKSTNLKDFKFIKDEEKSIEAYEDSIDCERDNDLLEAVRQKKQVQLVEHIMKRKQSLFGQDGQKKATGLRPQNDQAATLASIETLDDILREQRHRKNHKEVFGKSATSDLGLRAGESYAEGDNTDRSIRRQNSELIPLIQSDTTLQAFLDQNLENYKRAHKAKTSLNSIDEKAEQKYMRFKQKKLMRYATELRKLKSKSVIEKDEGTMREKPLISEKSQLIIQKARQGHKKSSDPIWKRFSKSNKRDKSHEDNYDMHCDMDEHVNGQEDPNVDAQESLPEIKPSKAYRKLENFKEKYNSKKALFDASLLFDYGKYNLNIL